MDNEQRIDTSTTDGEVVDTSSAESPEGPKTMPEGSLVPEADEVDDADNVTPAEEDDPCAAAPAAEVDSTPEKDTPAATAPAFPEEPCAAEQQGEAGHADDSENAEEDEALASTEPSTGEGSLPRFLTREEYRNFGDDPEPLPEGFEVIDGGAADEPVQVVTAPDPDDAQSAPTETPAPNIKEGSIEAATGTPTHAKAALAHSVSEGASSLKTMISHGAGAVRAVSEAKRAHAEAREQLEQLDGHIAEQAGELEHRRDIEGNYEQIVTGANARITSAQASIAAANTQKQAIATVIDTLKQQLEQMKAADTATERRLKAALDAAEGKEAAAREAAARVKRRLSDAERALERAEQNRTAGLDASQQAIKTAEARLDTLRAEFAEVQRNPSANSAAYSVRASELDAEISDAAHDLRAARDELPRVTAELEGAVETAKRILAEAKKPIDEAKKDFQAVVDETQKAREAFEQARSDAAARQKELKGRINEQEHAQKEQDRNIEGAQAEAEQAKAAIAEANEIHTTPEITERIAAALEADRAERVELVHQVEALAEREATVRDRTRSSRVKFLGLIAAAIVVVVAIVAMALLLG